MGKFRQKWFTWLRKTLMLIMVFSFSQVYASSGHFVMDDWLAEYADEPISVNDWHARNPWPWNTYFNTTNPDCASSWFYSLGPLGVRVYMHDMTWGGYSNFRAMFPEYLMDSEGLTVNAVEVIEVIPGSPAMGYLQAGDVIIGIDGQRIKSAQATYPDRDLHARDTRGLEISVGQLIDEAEGRGTINFTVIRPPVGGISITPVTREWQKVAEQSMMNWSERNTPFNVNVDLTGQGLFALRSSDGGNGNGYDHLYFDQFVLTNQTSGEQIPLDRLQRVTSQNGYGGISIDAEVNSWHVHASCNFEFKIPEGDWQLTGRIRPGGSATIVPAVHVIQKAEVPEEVAAYTQSITFDIPKIGSFTADFDPNCAKVKHMSAQLARRLAVQQNEDGSWSQGGVYAGAGFHTSMCGLGLLATGDPQYDEHVRRAAYYIAERADQTGWWAYPAGTYVMFLSEYYLRTGDQGILPGLNKAIDWARTFVTGDFVAGHKHHPGYGGSGWLGGGGTIAAGFAVAKHTPATMDVHLLSKMLERMQQLAPEGQMPYGRDRGRSTFWGTNATTQSWAAGNGPYFIANKVGTGPKYLTETMTQRFGSGVYGDADGGHATHVLPFVWACLSSNLCGDEAHKGNMEAFYWRLTLMRDYQGFVNKNTNRLEYHGAQGTIGNPYWRTGGILIILNAHKRNLAITGHPDYLAKYHPDITPVNHKDNMFWRQVHRNWTSVQAILGEGTLPSLDAAIQELLNLERGDLFGFRTFEIIESRGVAIATEILALTNLQAPEKQYYAEMMLKIGHNAQLARVDEVETNGLGNYRFSVNSYHPYAQWKSALPDAIKETNPAPSTVFSEGNVVLSDPSGTYLSDPITLAIGPTDLSREVSLSLPVSGTYELLATYTYSVGALAFSYSQPIVVNSNISMKDWVNYRGVWVPGCMDREYISWTMPIRLASGELLDCADREGKTPLCHKLDGTTVNLKGGYGRVAPDTRFEVLLVHGDQWEDVITEVRMLPIDSDLIIPRFSETVATIPAATIGENYNYSIASYVNNLSLDGLTFVKRTGPAWVQVTGDGKIQGIPTNADLGFNSLTVTVKDAGGMGSYFEVQLFVNGTDAQAVAVADTVIVTEDTPTVIAVLDNDSAGGVLSSFTNPKHGTLSQNANLLTYTPDPDFIGTDLFYYVADFGEVSSSAVVNITVLDGPDAPVFSVKEKEVTTQALVRYEVDLSEFASDQDSGAVLNYAVISDQAWVRINEDGLLTAIAPFDSIGENVVVVRVTDETGLYDEMTLRVTVTEVYNLVEMWTGLSGGNVSDLTGNSRFPDRPDRISFLSEVFELPANQGSSFGVRVRSWITAPVSGTYTFWIAADDTAELWLSSDESEINKQKIAYNDSWTNSRQWTKYSTQTSAGVVLEAGKVYYIEALMKENGGGDHLAVAWAYPGQSREVIPVASMYPNRLPDARPDVYKAATSVSTMLNVLGNDRDADGDILAVQQVTVPKHGLAVVENNQVNYTSVSGFSGWDEFSYTVHDGKGGQNTASVRVFVYDPSENNPPYLKEADLRLTTARVAFDYSFALMNFVEDIEGDRLYFSKTSGPDWLGVTASGELRGRPSLADVGTHSFAVVVHDGVNTPVECSFKVTVDETLMVNPGFEEALEGWEFSSNNVRVIEEAGSGRGAVEITGSGTVTQKLGHRLETGQTITVSCLHGQGAGDFLIELLAFANGQYTLISDSSSVVKPSTDDWDLVSVTATVPFALTGQQLAVRIRATTLNQFDDFEISFEAHTVIFELGDKLLRDGGGQLIQSVAHGKAAQAPKLFVAEEGWLFSGWDCQFDTVTADLIVTAQTKLKTYEVRFVIEHAQRVGGGQLIQTISHGAQAWAPTLRMSPGYAFNGWDVRFDQVTADLTVTLIADSNLQADSFDLTLEPGWNLLSVPLKYPNLEPLKALVGGPLWGWRDQHYQLLSDLAKLEGFWVFSEAQTAMNVRIEGFAIEEPTPRTINKWGLVGFAQAQLVDETNLSDCMYGWDESAYFNVETQQQQVHPGRGYWLYKPEVSVIELF